MCIAKNPSFFLFLCLFPLDLEHFSSHFFLCIQIFALQMFVAAAFYDLLVLCVCTLVRISVCVLVLGLIHMKKLRHFVVYSLFYLKIQHCKYLITYVF